MEQLFEPLLTHSKFPHVMTSRTGDQLDLIIKKIAGPRCGPRTIAGKPLAVCTLPRERVTQQATVPGVIAGRSGFYVASLKIFNQRSHLLDL